MFLDVLVKTYVLVTRESTPCWQTMETWFLGGSLKSWRLPAVLVNSIYYRHACLFYLHLHVMSQNLESETEKLKTDHGALTEEHR